MAKRITTLCLLLLLVAGAVWQTVYINRVTENTKNLLEPVVAAINENDWEKANASAEKLNIAWNKQKRIYCAIIDHEEVDLISAAATRLNSFCRTQNAEGALSEAAALGYYIEHLRQIEQVRFENIF